VWLDTADDAGGRLSELLGAVDGARDTMPGLTVAVVGFGRTIR